MITTSTLEKVRILRTRKIEEETERKRLEAMPCSLLKVLERPLLTNGGLSSAPNGVPVILIASDQPHREKLVTLWHEIVHLMRMAGGYAQDEASVEDAAKRLAAACPEALEWVGIYEANVESIHPESKP